VTDLAPNITDEAKSANLGPMDILKAAANLASNTAKLGDGLKKLTALPDLAKKELLVFVELSKNLP